MCAQKGSRQRRMNARRSKVGQGGFGGRGAFNSLGKNKPRGRVYKRDKSSDRESSRKKTRSGRWLEGSEESPRRGRERRNDRSISRSPQREGGGRRNYDNDSPRRGRAGRRSFENPRGRSRSRSRSREGSGERRRRPGPKIRDGPRGGQSRRSFEEYKKKTKYWREPPKKYKSRDTSSKQTEPREGGLKRTSDMASKKKKSGLKSIHPKISIKNFKDPDIDDQPSDVPNESELERVWGELNEDFTPEEAQKRIKEAKERLLEKKRSLKKGKKGRGTDDRHGDEISERELDNIYNQLQKESLPKDAEKAYTKAKRRAFGSEESDEEDETSGDPTPSELERDYADVDQDELWEKVQRKMNRPLDDIEMLAAIKARDKAEYLKEKAERKRKREEEGKTKLESSEKEITDSELDETHKTGHEKEFSKKDDELESLRNPLKTEDEAENKIKTITEPEWEDFLKEHVYNEKKQDLTDTVDNVFADIPPKTDAKGHSTLENQFQLERDNSAQNSVESEKTIEQQEEVMTKNDGTAKVTSEEDKTKEEGTKTKAIEDLEESWRKWVLEVEQVTGKKSDLPLVLPPEDEDEEEKIGQGEEQSRSSFPNNIIEDVKDTKAIPPSEAQLNAAEEESPNPSEQDQANNAQARYEKLLEDWDTYLDLYYQAFGKHADLPKAADLPAEADDVEYINEEEIKPQDSVTPESLSMTSKPHSTTFRENEEIKSEATHQEYTEEELTPYWPGDNHMIDDLAELNEKIEAIDTPLGENDDPTKPRITSAYMKEKFGIDKKELIDMWDKFLNLMAERPRSANEELRGLIMARDRPKSHEPPKPRRGPSVREQLRFVRAKNKAFQPKNEYERTELEKKKEWKKLLDHFSRDSQRGFNETVAEEEGVDVDDDRLTPELVDGYRAVLDLLDSPESFDLEKYRATLTKEELDELYHRNEETEDCEEEKKTSMDSQSSKNVAEEVPSSVANSPQPSVFPSKNRDQAGKVKKMWDYFVNVMKERHEKGLEKFLAEQPAGALNGEDAKELWQRYINFSSSQQESNQTIENQIFRNIEETQPQDIFYSKTAQPQYRSKEWVRSEGWNKLKNHMNKIRNLENGHPSDSSASYDPFSKEYVPRPYPGRTYSLNSSPSWDPLIPAGRQAQYRPPISGPGYPSHAGPTRPPTTPVSHYHPTHPEQNVPASQASNYFAERPRQRSESWTSSRQEFQPIQRRPYIPEESFPPQKQPASSNYQPPSEHSGYSQTPSYWNPSSEDFYAKQTRPAVGAPGYPTHMAQTRQSTTTQFDNYPAPQRQTRPFSLRDQFHNPIQREQTKPMAASMPSSEPLNLSYRLYQNQGRYNEERPIYSNSQTLGSDSFLNNYQGQDSRSITSWRHGTRPFQPSNHEDRAQPQVTWKPPLDPSPLSPENTGGFLPRNQQFQFRRNEYQGKQNENENCYHLTASSGISDKWELPRSSAELNEPLDR